MEAKRTAGDQCGYLKVLDASKGKYTGMGKMDGQVT